VNVLQDDVPPTLTLAACDVHVWDARVSAFAEHEDDLRATLDDDELQRADCFQFARDRLQYVIAHGLVRILLGRYLGKPAHRLRFETGPYGKPSLYSSVTCPTLEYNLSHSGDIVLIAVACGRAVGVDVERWADEIVYDDLAEYCFSPMEQAELAATDVRNKAAAFFAGWTRKEAYIKATGLGVSAGLDYFDVSLAAGSAAKLLCDRHTGSSAADWLLYDVALGVGYSGAIVARGSDWRLRQASFAPDALGPGEGSIH